MGGETAIARSGASRFRNEADHTSGFRTGVFSQSLVPQVTMGYTPPNTNNEELPSQISQNASDIFAVYLQ